MTKFILTLLSDESYRIDPKATNFIFYFNIINSIKTCDRFILMSNYYKWKVFNSTLRKVCIVDFNIYGQIG